MRSGQGNRPGPLRIFLLKIVSSIFLSKIVSKGSLPFDTTPLGRAPTYSVRNVTPPSPVGDMPGFGVTSFSAFSTSGEMANLPPKM